MFRAIRQRREILVAAHGAGPLFQRDYWALVSHCRLSPSQVIDLVASDFAAFAPSELVSFRPLARGQVPLEIRTELEVKIRLAGTFFVGVLHRDGNSFTLGTMSGHPEAGRITFGAYRNNRGDLIFHIRSRARSSSRGFYAGFLAMGEAMQTTCWAEFVNRVALTVGDGVIGVIHAETRRIQTEAEDQAVAYEPTFIASGD